MLIGQTAEAAGIRRSPCIDILRGSLSSITPTCAGMMHGRVSACHQHRTPLGRCVRIGRVVLTVRPGQSIGADLSLPSSSNDGLTVLYSVTSPRDCQPTVSVVKNQVIQSVQLDQLYGAFEYHRR